MSTDDALHHAFAEHSRQFDDAAGNGAADSPRESMADFSAAVELLGELGQAGLEDVSENLLETILLLGKLADTVDSSLSDFNDDDPEVLERVDFVIEGSRIVKRAAMADRPEDIDREQLDLLREDVQLRLDAGDHASSFDAGDPWNDDGDPPPDADPVAPSPEEIAKLLSGLSAQMQSQQAVPVSPSTPPTENNHPDEQTDEPSAFVRPSRSDAPTVGRSSIPRPQVDRMDVDEEIREAFMDDATRGLESMEQALLDLEASPGAEGPVKTIGRELHTIKGASASISMEHLAAYIHEVEELIRQTQESGQPVTPELLLPHVDLIRARVEGHADPDETPAEPTAVAAASPAPIVPAADVGPATDVGPAGAVAAPAAPPSPRPATQASTSIADSHGDDETVRVKASQLNRLMDMLSELVMLRNQRDTEISELKGIHDELIHSVTRIRMLSHEGEALLASEHLADPVLAEEGVSFSHLNEVANDVLESAQRLRDCYRPVAEGNQAVSQFIRNFRLELVQLRRMPVSGLFRRLHRAISDAARTEQKQVRVELMGENTGIERSLQERIFEPLLHIVRNSVSHGIETPPERVAAGKLPQGVVTLHAHSGPDLLVIEVRDDGRGLDYDAIRRRGIERGLIDGDKSISHAELSRLIFHPGFSTRQSANQISGRGVGMDVVASTLERMRGWVEVESEHGCGSTIRLSLPLPSMIQHAMVFRCGGQLFALPAQSVRRTGHFDAKYSPVDLSDVLALHRPEADGALADPNQRQMIELALGSAAIDSDRGGDFALLVDRVLGPEEVVVRPMPPMLKSHPLCIGATLSGMGEVVLLLDPRGLAETAKGIGQVVSPLAQEERHSGKDQPKVLVVDDSKSARIRVVRALQKYPVTVVEVDDGQAAMELLAKETFVTVFTDIDMPRMSGLELLQSIKGEPRLESIPVIVISSRSTDTAGKQARAIGALEYIQKPLTPERLDEVVGQFAWAKA